MKLGAIDHPKTLDLADRLDVGLAQTLGHLTLLWAFTARKAPCGDVGKWPDGAIARACDWHGNSASFVTALIEAGFVERHSQHRLIVHDWKDHAEKWVHGVLANIRKAGKEAEFVTAETVEASGEPTREHSTVPHSLPSPAKTSQAKPKDGRAHALPADWKPSDEHRALAEKEGVDLDREAEQFRDHWAATGKPMKDWDACFRKWLRNAAKFAGKKPKPAQTTKGKTYTGTPEEEISWL